MPIPNVVPKVLLTDPAANRFNDQLLAVLNPILRNVAGDLTGPVAAPLVRGLFGLPLAESMAAPTLGQVIAWNGLAWAPTTGGGGGGVTSVSGASPITSTGGATPVIGISGTPVGGVAYADGSTLAYTSAGTAGAPLVSGGAGAPSFAVLGAIGGGTGLATYAAGDLLYATGPTTLARLPIGASGTVLLSTGTAPAWTVPSASNTGAGIGGYRATTTTPDTIALTDYTVDVTTTGAFTLNLPTAGSGAGQAAAGRIFVVKNTGGAIITVTPAGAQLIDSAATFVVQTQFASFTFQSTGSGWVLL